MKAATALSRMLSLRGGGAGVLAAGLRADFRADLRAIAASLEYETALIEARKDDGLRAAKKWR
jgi:hypothetical protein